MGESVDAGMGMGMGVGANLSNSLVFTLGFLETVIWYWVCTYIYSQIISSSILSLYVCFDVFVCLEIPQEKYICAMLESPVSLAQLTTRLT